MFVKTFLTAYTSFNIGLPLYVITHSPLSAKSWNLLENYGNIFIRWENKEDYHDSN